MFNRAEPGQLPSAIDAGNLVPTGNMGDTVDYLTCPCVGKNAL